MTTGTFIKQFPDEYIGSLRTGLIVASIIGIALGIVALVWTRPTVLVLAILFGLSLIAAGFFRIYGAFAALLLSTGWRIFWAILGILMVLAGVIALFSPGDAIWFLAVFIGIGWIFQGATDLSAAIAGSGHAPRFLLGLSGVLSIIAGIVMISIPGLALTTFVWISGILLIAISVVTLLTLPKKVSGPGDGYGAGPAGRQPTAPA
ncbi:HdeD family acid-resistance protein [Gordonia sinesedis]